MGILDDILSAIPEGENKAQEQQGTEEVKANKDSFDKAGGWYGDEFQRTYMINKPSA